MLVWKGLEQEAVGYGQPASWRVPLFRTRKSRVLRAAPGDPHKGYPRLKGSPLLRTTTTHLWRDLDTLVLGTHPAKQDLGENIWQG